MKIHKDVRRVSLVPGVTAGAYSAGDIVGGLLEFPNVFSTLSKKGLLLSASVIDDAGQTATYDLFFFRSLPAGTYTDNAAFAPSEADLVLCSPVIQIASSNRFAAGTRSITSLSSLNSFVESDSSTLYAVAVDRTGRTGASITDLTFVISVEVVE